MSSSFADPNIVKKDWDSRLASVTSDRTVERLYDAMNRLERGDATALIDLPVPYRLGYAAALMDKLDGGRRIKQHFNLAGKGIERQAASLHALFPSKYKPTPSDVELDNDDEDREEVVTMEQREINGTFIFLIRGLSRLILV